MAELAERMAGAVRHFWTARTSQAAKQGEGGDGRSAVTGGKQMDGFVELVRTLLVEAGCPEASVLCKKRLELPGWFRAEKRTPPRRQGSPCR